MIVSYLPGALFIVSGLPQAIKLLRTRDSKGISVWMYILTIIASGIIVFDSFNNELWGVAISNIASEIITGLNLFLIVKYRNNNGL
jgi:uncharacterized protein with PQ loop repeat